MCMWDTLGLTEPWRALDLDLSQLFFTPKRVALLRRLHVELCQNCFVYYICQLTIVLFTT